MLPKNKKQFIKLNIKEAQDSNWDDLAWLIMCLEYALLQEKDPKVLKLLNIRLEIFEDEKSNRVVDTFSMEHLMTKEFPYIEEDEIEFDEM